MDFNFYDSGNSSELVASIPITKPPTPYQLVPMFKLEIPNVKAGDLIDVSAYGQVTQNNGTITQYTATNVMFAFVIKAGAPGAETLEVCEARGVNINRLRHHETWQIATGWKAPVDYPVLSLVVLGYSASTIALAGWVLTVDKDYGRLQAKHWYTPAAIAAVWI